MKKANWYPLKIASSGLLLLGIASFSTQNAHAQFTSPPGQGVPKGTAGGGTRPTQQCLQQPNDQESLLALAPTRFLGLTSQENPAVWVYVPKTTAQTLEFSLFTSEQDGIYQVQLPVSAPGLVKIAVPQAAKLKTGKPYYWTAALICNPEQRTNDWVVTGWIRQQPFSPDLQRQLAAATPEQRLKLYAQANFWYEALNAYLALQQTQPNTPNLSSLWADLLQTAGLSAVPLQGKLPRISNPTPPTQAYR